MNRFISNAKTGFMIPALMMITGLVAFTGLLVYGITSGRLGNKPIRTKRKKPQRRSTAVIRKVERKQSVRKLYPDEGGVRNREA